MFRNHYKRSIADDTEVNLMPFINFLVVLIPVLMLSAEFSETNILEAQPATGGARIDSASILKPAMTTIVVCISDSAVNIASNERFLAGIGCSSCFFPAEEISGALASIRSALPAKMDRITIASDITVKYQRLIDVMDLARKNGFTDVSIARLRS
jgi:biopolymer transport protein ExbD